MKETLILLVACAGLVFAGCGKKDDAKGEKEKSTEGKAKAGEKAEEKPAEKPAEEKAAEEKAPEAPAEEKAEEKPAEEKAEAAPAEEKAEEKPAEAKAADAPAAGGDAACDKYTKCIEAMIEKTPEGPARDAVSQGYEQFKKTMGQLKAANPAALTQTCEAAIKAFANNPTAPDACK